MIGVKTTDHKNLPRIQTFSFSFEGGKLFKTYKLLDVANPKFMTFSVSHFRWLYAENKLSITDSKLRFTTFDMTHYVFDVDTGKLISQEVDDIFSKGAVFVYGGVRELGKNRYEIKVECSIRGDARKGSRIEFSSDKIGWKGGGFNETLILQNGLLIDRKGVIFNNCN